MLKHKKFHVRAAWAVAIVAGLAVLGAVSATAAFAYSYKDTFYPGVSVAGVNLSGLSREEGAKRVAAKAEVYRAHAFKIVLPDTSKPTDDNDGYEDKEIDADGTQLGLTFSTDAAVEAAWARGHASRLDRWLADAVPLLVNGHTGLLAYQVDHAELQAFITTTVVPAAGAPVPAKLTVSGDKVAVDASATGFTVDAAALEGVLVKGLENASDTDTTYLRAPVTVAKANVTEDSVQPLADTLNAIGNAPLTFKAGDASLKPTRTQLLAWFSPVQAEDGTLSLTVSQAEVSKYLKAQSKTVDATKSLDAAVKGLGGLIAKTPEQLKSPVSVALTAAASKPVNDTNFTPNLSEGRYVEIDLSSQRLYLVETNTLVKSYVVSSGKWATPTPTGTFAVRNKARRPLSRAYGLYLPYWVDFKDGEYGLHELPEWPNGYKEGQNHLGIPVSHGCVRLGIGDAKEVYDWVSIGTPIHIHG